MCVAYDPEHIAAFFDAYAEREWGSASIRPAVSWTSTART